MEPLTIRRSIDLDVEAGDAWHLVGDPEGLGRWLADDVDVQLTPGSVGTVTDDDVVRGIEVDHVDDGRALAFRWWPEDDAGRASHVHITLSPLTAGGTRIEVVETLPGRPTATASAASGHRSSDTSVRWARWEVAALLVWSCSQQTRVR